jgi:hypothetical protein
MSEYIAVASDACVLKQSHRFGKQCSGHIQGEITLKMVNAMYSEKVDNFNIRRGYVPKSEVTNERRIRHIDIVGKIL